MSSRNGPTYQRKTETDDGPYKRSLWNAAFGLQQVDGLQPSAYVRDLASQNVDGRMTLVQVGESLDAYYREEDDLAGRRHRAEEADKVSHRIVCMLADGSFSLDSRMLNVIHERLFRDIDDRLYRPGAFKDEQLIKCERILNGDSVLYGAPMLYQRSLDMLFARELEHSYEGYADGPVLSWSDANALARFAANVWMVHPFAEGNTRTMAVFLALYLRSMGFDVENAPFERHASFFRGALVRATYQNRPIGVGLDLSHLVAFLSKLVEDCAIELDYDALWCVPLFEFPKRVRNVSPADAAPMQEQLIREGITERLLGGGNCDSKG